RKGGLEDERPRSVAAPHALDRAFGREEEAAILRGAEEVREEGARVEARHAEPVDRAVPANEGRGLAVANQGIVFNAGGHGGGPGLCDARDHPLVAPIVAPYGEVAEAARLEQGEHVLGLARAHLDGEHAERLEEARRLGHDAAQDGEAIRATREREPGLEAD